MLKNILTSDNIIVYYFFIATTNYTIPIYSIILRTYHVKPSFRYNKVFTTN